MWNFFQNNYVNFMVHYFMDSVSETMVRGPPVVLEICPYSPFKKYRRKIKIQINCISHYSWKSQSFEITHGNRLSLFLPLLIFMKFITVPFYRLPTLLSATKEGFEGLWTWCFSPSFPCTSDTVPTTQTGISRVYNRGPKYRTTCINDILNNFADTQSAHWNGHILYVLHQ